MTQMPPIPDNLRRTKEPEMTQHQPKKPRTITVLPTTLSDGSFIPELTFEELVAKRAIWEKAVADHEQEELELRAIRVAIRKKA
jgi:hypothetical protein